MVLFAEALIDWLVSYSVNDIAVLYQVVLALFDVVGTLPLCVCIAELSSKLLIRFFELVFLILTFSSISFSRLTHSA